MARFMYGRNGADQLCWALFIAELVLSLLPALVPGQAFAAFIHYTTLFLCVYLEHKYVKCSCGAYCRVPRSVGMVELTCPKCGKKRIVKT